MGPTDRLACNLPERFMNQLASFRRRAGLRLFSPGLRQHVLIEREVNHQPLQAAVFCLQLSQSSQFAHAEMRVFLLPDIQRLLGNPEPTADIAHAGAGLGLTEGIYDLLFAKLCRFTD